LLSLCDNKPVPVVTRIKNWFATRLRELSIIARLGFRLFQDDQHYIDCKKSDLHFRYERYGAPKFTFHTRGLPEYVFTVLHRICIVASEGMVTTYMGLIKKLSLPTGPPADAGVHDPDNSLVSGRSFSGLPRENGSVQKQDRV
jgi:hypothetical protein